MTTVELLWPYAGLVLGVALLVVLFIERRHAVTSPGWVLALLWPMYLLHQFEEHGIDALGRHYAFLGELCSTLGYGAIANCPADPAFIFAVNAVGCQIAFAMAWVFRRTRPLVSACAWGIPIVNAVTHIVAAVVHRNYNPGLLTAVFVFIPLSIFMLITVLRTQTITAPNVARIVGTGIFVHAVLIASLLLRARGWLSHEWLLVINALNGMAPLAFGANRAQ